MKRKLTCCLLLLFSVAANAATVRYIVNLDGPSEFPPVASPGTGAGFVDLDAVAHSMRVFVTFSGLVGTTTASHIHAPTTLPNEGTAGVATQTPSFIGFPLGVTSGSFDRTFDMTDPASYRAGYLTGFGGDTSAAEAALFSAIASGNAYLNIHTTFAGGGEIRGFFAPIPEPATYALVAASLAGLAFARRRRNIHH